MPVLDCATGQVRQLTSAEEAAIAAERTPAVPVERETFDFSPRDFLVALLTAMVQEGVIPSAAKAQAIATRTRDALKR